MNRKLIAPTAALCALLSVPATAEAYTVAQPRMVTIPGVLPKWAVVVDVTLDADTLVTVTSSAYRHPVEVEYEQTLPAGTHRFSIPCTPIVLPHSWPVYFNGVRVTSASLKCE